MVRFAIPVLALSLATAALAEGDTKPGLSGSEQTTLLLQVSACWNLGALSTEALATVVEVDFDVMQDGKPDPGSIRMTSYRGGSEAAANQAFQAARRAIIRCGVNGFELPVGKYEHWRHLRLTFDPDNMRWR